MTRKKFCFFLNEKRKILYHGTGNSDFKPDFHFDNSENDYGSGLYLTPYEEMALMWSRSFYQKKKQGFACGYELVDLNVLFVMVI